MAKPLLLAACFCGYIDEWESIYTSYLLSTKMIERQFVSIVVRLRFAVEDIRIKLGDVIRVALEAITGVSDIVPSRVTCVKHAALCLSTLANWIYITLMAKQTVILILLQRYVRIVIV